MSLPPVFHASHASVSHSKSTWSASGVLLSSDLFSSRFWLSTPVVPSSGPRPAPFNNCQTRQRLGFLRRASAKHPGERRHTAVSAQTGLRRRIKEKGKQQHDDKRHSEYRALLVGDRRFAAASGPNNSNISATDSATSSDDGQSSHMNPTDRLS